MAPPITDLPPAPAEHYYTIDERGKPQEVIYIAPRDVRQIYEADDCDIQSDFFIDATENAAIKSMWISMNKMRRKLFRENGLLKKRINELEYENNELQLHIDYICDQLQIKKIKRIV